MNRDFAAPDLVAQTETGLSTRIRRNGGMLRPTVKLSMALRRLLATPMVYSLLALILLWQAIASLKLLPASILPPPLAVLRDGVTLSRQAYGAETLPGHALTSLLRVSAGFALGVLAGIVAGILMKVVRLIRYFVDPILAFLRPVPPFAFITVLVLWFGLEETPKVLLIFLAVFPPIAVYTSAAMDALPSEMRDAAISLGARSWKFFWHAQLPAALPDILVGMRVTLALGWTAVMGAELVAATSGLGWMLWNAVRFLQTDVIFVAAISIAVIGALMDLTIVVLTHVLTGGWRSRMRSGVS